MRLKLTSTDPESRSTTSFIHARIYMRRLLHYFFNIKIYNKAKIMPKFQIL